MIPSASSSTHGTRRTFLKTSAVASAGVTITSAAAGAVRSADEKVIVGIMGVSRGSALAQQFAAVPGVEVRYLCDIDSKRLAAFHESFSKTVAWEVKTVGDFRKMLDDPELDVMVCAAPNHWHAPSSILACNAGKHVYAAIPGD